MICCSDPDIEVVYRKSHLEIMEDIHSEDSLGAYRESCGKDEYIDLVTSMTAILFPEGTFEFSSLANKFYEVKVCLHCLKDLSSKESVQEIRDYYISQIKALRAEKFKDRRIEVKNTNKRRSTAIEILKGDYEHKNR